MGFNRGNSDESFANRSIYILSIYKNSLETERPDRTSRAEPSRAERKPVKEITNYYRRRFIEKNWFVLGIAEGDPYRGSLGGLHSGPSLRHIEVYELSTPGFATRTLQFPDGVLVRSHTNMLFRRRLSIETDLCNRGKKNFPLFSFIR